MAFFGGGLQKRRQENEKYYYPWPQNRRIGGVCQGLFSRPRKKIWGKLPREHRFCDGKEIIMEEKSLIFEKISKIMAEILPVEKLKENRTQGFKFRGIDDVYNAVHTPMANNGVFSTSKINSMELGEKKTTSSTMQTVLLNLTYYFWAQDGSNVSLDVIGYAFDTGDKAFNKAMSVGHKYALLQLFCIPTADIDPDAESHQIIAPHIEHPTAQSTPKTEKPSRSDAEYRAVLAAYISSPQIPGYISLEKLSEFQGKNRESGAPEMVSGIADPEKLFGKRLQVVAQKAERIMKAANPPPITEAQIQGIELICKQKSISEEALISILGTEYGCEGLWELKKTEAEKLIKELQL